MWQIHYALLDWAFELSPLCGAALAVYWLRGLYLMLYEEEEEE